MLKIMTINSIMNYESDKLIRLWNIVIQRYSLNKK